MRTIYIPVHNIEITLTDDGGGSISSDLRESCPYCGQPGCYLHCYESQAGGFEDEDLEDEEEMWARKAFNDIMDGLESFILAQAISGCDVECPAFFEALESALQGIGNNV